MVKGDFVFAIPGDLDAPTGGYAYDRRMIAELRDLGWRPEVLGLGDGFPHPSALALAAAGAALADVPKGRPIVIDGLAFGVMPEAARKLRETHPLIALVHHPLALETGVTPEQAAALRESETAGARLRARGRRQQSGHRPHARRRLRRRRRSASPSRRPAPTASRSSCGQTPHQLW